MELSVKEPLVDLDSGETSGGHSLLSDLAVPLSPKSLVELSEVLNLGLRLLSATDTSALGRGLLCSLSETLTRDDWLDSLDWSFLSELKKR